MENMENEVTIRKAGLEDAALLKELYLKILKESPDAFVDIFGKESEKSVQDWEKRVEKSKSIIFIAERSGAPIGMGRGIYEEDDPNIPHVDKLGVLSEFRGKGIGQALMGDMEKWATENGADRIRLHVLADQEKTVNFYKANGFNIVETLKGDIQRHDGTWQDVYLMEKILEIAK